MIEVADSGDDTLPEPLLIPVFFSLVLGVVEYGKKRRVGDDASLDFLSRILPFHSRSLPRFSPPVMQIDDEWLGSGLHTGNHGGVHLLSNSCASSKKITLGFLPSLLPRCSRLTAAKNEWLGRNTIRLWESTISMPNASMSSVVLPEHLGCDLEYLRGLGTITGHAVNLLSRGKGAEAVDQARCCKLALTYFSWESQQHLRMTRFPCD